jgi:hypothetical protein
MPWVLGQVPWAKRSSNRPILRSLPSMATETEKGSFELNSRCARLGCQAARDYGWKRGKQWGFEVRVPPGINCIEASPDVKRPLADWLDLGLIPASGAAISKDMLDDQASLVLPAGTYGPGFLVLENFQVFRRYNASDLYAIFVGHLADLIAGSPAFEKAWTKLPRFSNRDIEQTQKLLSNQKYYSDTVDGRLGSVTRRAIGQYQKR